MPIYMDVHIVPGVTAKNVAEAHRLDLLHQHEYDCKCMTYWIDEARESIFCLIEAPGKDAVEQMHSRAHGLVPNKIIEVSNEVVESFLGRIYDPPTAEESNGLKVFTEPSYRILLLTRMADPALLKYELGVEKANELMNLHNCIIRKNVAMHGGREAEHGGNGFIISFSSAAKAVSCALAIQLEMPAANADALGFSIAINAGEPVEKSNELFGDTIQLAASLCTIAKNSQVIISSSVKELIAKDHFQLDSYNIASLNPQDEALQPMKKK